MSHYDCDETDRAVKAFHRRCEREGFVASQPNRHLTGRDGDTITIANVNGVMARYRVTATGRLRLEEF